jgi:single-stranded-DNA-specific exonuclease
MQVPAPRYRHRTPDWALACIAEHDYGLDPLAARLLAARARTAGLSHDIAINTLIQPAVSPSLRHLDPPDGLPDLDIAVTRIVHALAHREVIGVVTDHDVDGTTGHAILRECLIRRFGHPREKVLSFSGHRLKEGYGISDKLARRILEATPPPSLIITADHGSSDEARIADLARAGVDTVVTDHHGIPAAGPPASAIACVSPIRPESRYPDPYIAGGMVAWLLCCAVRQALIRAGRLPHSAPSLADLLDYAALSTIADVVDLAKSRNNRIVVRYGLTRIAAGARPCWRAARQWLGEGPVGAEALAFKIAPKINARGRLDEALTAAAFLLAPDDKTAATIAAVLADNNASRRAIEAPLREAALAEAAKQTSAGASALSIWLPEGHAGVHGIVASRVVDSYGRPTVCLSPGEGVIKGSARTAAGIDIRAALAATAERLGGTMPAFGGHPGAGGLTLASEAAIGPFRHAFNAAVEAQLKARARPAILAPWRDLDASPADPPDTETLSQLSALEPFGRGFEAPRFIARLGVTKARKVGADGAHIKLTFQAGSRVIDGIWFSAAVEPRALIGQRCRVVYHPTLNVYRGRMSAELMVEAAHPLD